MGGNRHRRTEHQRNEPTSKLDEFPEDFDDVFFHNQTVDADRKIAILRNLVYKKIKNTIIDRVAEYKDDDVKLSDNFLVEFPVEGYTKFQWAVIREELWRVGFDAEFVFENDAPNPDWSMEVLDENDKKTLEERGKIVKLVVPVERHITLVGKPEDLDSDDEGSDSE